MAFGKEQLYQVYINLNEITHLNFVFNEYGNDKFIRLNSYDMPKIIKDAEVEAFRQLTDRVIRSDSDAVCYFENKLKLRYIATGIFDGTIYLGTIILGPYLNVTASDKLVHDVLTENSLSRSLRYVLNDFYAALPTLSGAQEKAVGNITLNLIDTPMKTSASILMEDENKESDLLSGSLDDYEMDIVKVREIYKIEAELLHYISMGDEKKALEMTSGGIVNIIERFPEAPLRNMKNLNISMNTLFRKAVQQKHVDPFLIHTVSEKFAIRIENARSTTEIYNLFPDMIHAYCKLINDYSNAEYSDLVSKTVNYIRLNFDKSFNLSDLAQELYVHPNYLSKKFKVETDMTITAFINQIRIKEACFLLKQGDLSVADVAYSVGYNDKKYFSKVFKKLVGQSPTDYRNYGD